jgi:predicted  nucleic acid-binding Zn-ribbon protein
VQAYVVLQTELQKTQQQQAELRREWNNGEPERRADELKQPQKYQERVAQLRAALQRVDADVAGLQRELSRLSSITSGAKP